MLKNKISLPCLFLILINGLGLLAESNRAFAQQNWSFDQCIQFAIEQNIQIKQAKLGEGSAELDLRQSKYDFLPNLSADVNTAYNFGRSVDPTTYTFVKRTIQTAGLSASSSTSLFGGLRKWNNLRMREYDLSAALENIRQISDNVTLNVASLFLQSLLAGEEKEIAIQKKNLTQTQVERTRKLYESGTIAESEYLNIRAQLERDEVLVTAANNQEMLALSNLALTINTNPEGFAITKPAIGIDTTQMTPEISAESVYEEAATYNPAVKQAYYRLKSSEKSLHVARSFMYPNLAFFYNARSNYSNAGFREAGVRDVEQNLGFIFDSIPLKIKTTVPNYEDAPFSFQLNENLSHTIGLSLSIPLFNGLSARTATAKSKLNVINSQYNLDLSKQNLRRDVYQAYASLLAAIATYKSALKSLAAAKLAFENMEKRFEAGAINSFDYEMAQNNFIASRADLAKARYEYVFRTKILDFYLGKPIRLDP